ncbi:MAG: hypothetical protein KC635_14470, partial [Myxococcales bacterium]|nr:hypothetical protein [Myxococcales bacterium]
DACDAATGDCTHALAPGATCEDGDPCTAGDACDAAGACVSGGPNPCDDGNPCTIDSCGAGGCAHLATQNACCAGVVSVCDDGNPCTDDSCDPATAGCTHTANTAACDDRNACTAGDACQDGACVPGAPVVCEPAGACTTAVCDRNAGCRVYPASGTPCDDGVACTTDDTCVSGACVGDDTDCACTPPIPPNAVRLTAMRLGGAGEGVDVDGDPATCEPSASCSGGVDNAFGTLGAVVNPSIQEAIDAGSLVLVLDLDALANGPATVAVHTGARAPGCAAEPCPYVLAATGFADPPLPTDPTCVPRFVLAGTWALPTLTAGGDDAVIPIELPLSAGASLSLTLRRAHLTGTVTVSGGAAATFSGVLAGAIAKGEVLAAIDGLTSFPAGLTRDQVKGLVSALVATDIDADGNGVAESSSIALVVEGVAVQIVEGTP